MVSTLVTGLFVLVALAGIAIGLLVGLTRQLRAPSEPRPDPSLEMLRRLMDETERRRAETSERLAALRETIHRGLGGV